ncbi:dmX-like protein 2 [Stomoxys calcitrans]|uniref:RAVE complex protein Rav1 C-terminal domain-containing protein n=1 Tax=Stomoxys calcitrans TaxID=35570 RepID=A0A1I8PDC4_STOCA|nr:dmX-like protein 2 [Stomoxys calcitrans]
MNCHQILSGACNAGDRCFAIGSVEGIPFTAYAAGCNIVVLASTFERVQIIPGATHGYVKISALDCSTDTGKIAAAYENKICIFEPTPVLQTEKHFTHFLDYRWVQTGSFNSHSHVITLSWNLEGTRLLTGGSTIQLWKEKSNEFTDDEPTSVKFVIGGDRENKTPTSESVENATNWENIWSCQTAIPIYHMAFSPDGTLFATCGRNDRLVKIWYENKQILFPSKNGAKSIVKDDTNDLNFTYIYIAHPRAVTNIIWRKTSKYMPKGSVSNMIVTSCLDNICRVWIETVLPDDGLINMSQFDPLAIQNPKFRTHRHKHRFMQRLKHMKTCFHIRRHAKNGTNVAVGSGDFMTNNYPGPIPSLPSSCSVHDFHSYGFHGNGISQGMHFHLAASINAETDIPLVPSMQSTSDSSNQNNFVLHWLNNKEMDFTIQAEAILQELTKKVIHEENINAGVVNASEHIDNLSNGGASKKKYMKTTSKSVSVDDNSTVGDESKASNFQNYQTGLQNVNSMSNTTSLNSLNNDSSVVNQLTDSLDIKIDCLLRDWHQSPDLLFAIHPVDGSFLIWVVEWLDDFYPGSFRQAQVSFSTRIPNAFPLGDSMSMSTMVSLYNTGTHPLIFREIANNVKSKDHDILSEEEDMSIKDESIAEENEENSSDDKEMKASNGHDSDNCEKFDEKVKSSTIATTISPSVSMVTKHSNGTLNLWQLSFAYKTRFTQVLSIGHVSRVSGHRFRVNDINCHPVLPLLVSTSHHNLSEFDNKPTANTSNLDPNGVENVFTTSGFCSELILWRVDSVGPLCHSGGVSELARINSPEISAFSNVAWIPTLLPSTTLGGYSNSPSACFVASDGEHLRVYQAVIDARTLLAEISSSESITKLQKSTSLSSLYSNASSTIKGVKFSLHDKLKVVSQQSTARPGCIIQLDPISDAKHDWQNTQFLHVFQAQLITGGDIPKSENCKPTNRANKSDMDAIVDLQQNAEFEEPFYIVIIEKTLKGSTIHMWRIVISSKEQKVLLPETAMYVPDSNLTQEAEDIDAYRKMSEINVDLNNQKKPTEPTIEPPHIVITTQKVCTQEFPLPEGVDVIHASPAAGHLSSSSIYPACYAPYIIVTACSDSISRFWKCEAISKHKRGLTDTSNQYVWSEWKMFSKKQDSAIDIPGQPLNISAAYSGRIACAYKYGKSFTRPSKSGDPDSRYINLCVGIFECESSGGSEWVLEDTIHLKNIHLPRINIDHGIDLSYLHDNRILQKKQRLNQVLHNFTTHDETRSPRSGDSTPETNVKNHTSLLAVPSFSTLQSLRKSIAENGNTCPLTQKHLVQLDWVSKEDGSHILTVAVGSKILLYTPVSSDIAQANIKAMKESRSANRPILRKASSLAQPHFNDEIRWMKLRQIDLQTADGLPPLPMQISWVRDGILVVAMDSEMHVYSQWKPRFCQQHSVEDVLDNRNLRDEDLRSIANESSKLRIKSAASMPLMSKVSTANLQLLSKESKKKVTGTSSNNVQNSSDAAPINEDYMTDFGLFQASRIACPVLPQYHPKQLMELLNCGKIRWVKAILAHLVRCLSVPSLKGNNDNDDASTTQKSWSRSRTLSISYTPDTTAQSDHRGSTTQIPEELMLDYAEITSIPPLPLWVLLNADKELSCQGPVLSEDSKGYDQLFEMDTADDSLDDLLENENDYKRTDRRLSIPEKQNISHFGPRQGQILSRLLTHTHLPGLSSLDQMHLLALADTVSTCNTDFSEKFITESGKSATKDTSGNGLTESLDDCGLRFLLAMKHYSYLLRCLPLNQRTQFQKHGIGTSNIVWAFHSESEEELLNLIPSYKKGDLKWSTLRDLGVGYWVRNINILRHCVEKLAKCAYQLKQDPLDAALYYLAMKKKSIVWGLFRSKRDEKMTQFFANNFSEDRWRKAALKNAFVLLGKQRFDHAVAFFLLANSLNDAIEVCIQKLDDFQLALIIARLYEGDIDINTNSTYRKLLTEHVLGSDHDSLKFNIEKAHPDPFLRSMTYWIMKRHQESLNTLLLSGVGQCHAAFKEEDMFKPESQSTNPNVFNFYIYLRTHPLLVRQNLALSAQEKKISHVVLSGFSYSGDVTKNANDKQVQIEDSISSIERQLYFTTAHGHFKAGCPALALEVLNKLPTKVIDSSDTEDIDSPSSIDNELIKSGIIDWEHQTSADKALMSSATDLDWGSPLALQKKEDEPFKIEWDEDEDGAQDNVGEMFEKGDIPPAKVKKDAIITANKITKIDIMAQQLKFVACLKILMEELSTLATGFEVDGGQLRYQLYIWLEKEVEALQQLCNYCKFDSSNLNNTSEILKEKDNSVSYILSEKPTLHEILLHEKHDFEAKVMRAAKRKKWLKANETLLRTLLSYCSLHGASGGGLASVRMEVVLLLQELQQEKTQQQLLSPLPFPTTLPLLSACVAGNKTVIADPIKYLQSQTIDMLHSVINFSPFVGLDTNAFCEIFIIRDLAVALSSCIYQSLCDSESFVVHNSFQNGFQSPGIENIAKLNSSFECSHLIGNTNIYNRKRIYSMDEPTTVCTTPSRWPGVANLRALLAREKDEDIPKLNVLLLESFIATYVSLATYALVTCDSRILYRLIVHNFTIETWSTIFGGGMKKLLRKATCENQAASYVSSEEQNDDNSVWNSVTSSITKQRVKLNMKILGNFASNNSSTNMKEDKPTYREQFVPPEMSMLSYFLAKPKSNDFDDYDTDDPYESENEGEEDDVIGASSNATNKERDNKEHLDPTSYSWCILRVAIMKVFIKKVQDFVNVSGIEIQDLPVLSPLSHEVLRALNKWQEVALEILLSKGPPSEDYIPGCFANSGVPGLSIHRYRSLLSKDNTPFSASTAAGPVRRLWNFLVRQDEAQDVFIKVIFGKKMDGTFKTHSNAYDVVDNAGSSSTKEANEPIRIIHKDHESILAFCLNNSSSSMIAVANPREVQEFNISLLLESPNWYEDECDYDLMNISKDNETGSSSGFLMIQSSEQTPFASSQELTYNTNSSQSGRGTDLILKHKIDNVKRMSSHPLMPLYLTGGQDGSVQIWEWGHQQVVCTPRASGTFAKVTRCRFSEQGNKFGIGDGDGNLSLWQAGIASQNNKSFFTYQCHNKTLSDFVFLGSCSLLATAGQSSENKNIIVWDTLLPQKKSCVSAFTCHDQGASCFVFAPQHQILISCGKKGDICIFDMRQRILKQRLQGHDSAIKCISLDPHEEFFATGSIEGDIKIWSLNQFTLIKAFSGEHAKNSFFKQFGQGVSQIQIDAYGRIFSCGSDGCMKVRQLFEKDTIVQTMY